MQAFENSTNDDTEGDSRAKSSLQNLMSAQETCSQAESPCRHALKAFCQKLDAKVHPTLSSGQAVRPCSLWVIDQTRTYAGNCHIGAILPSHKPNP